MALLCNLFITFFKIGMFTFGGGYAMIPLLQAELINKKGWTTEEELMDYYSIGQCTPGIIAVNVSTFIGYKMKKIAGAVTATLGIVTPSILIILALANIINLYMENQYVIHAFAGVRIVVIALMVDVVLKMWNKAVSSWVQALIFFAALGALIVLAASPVTVVLCAGFVGLLLRY